MNYDLAIQKATQIIKDEEDLYKVLPDGRIQAYWDSKGKIWTIGWGNTYYKNGSAVKEGDIISRKDADDLLKVVVAQKEKAIRGYVDAEDVNENKYAALISLAYNCGEGAVRNSKVLQLINAGASDKEVEEQYKKTCITAKGEYVANLYNRRTRELKLFFSEAKDYLQRNPEISIVTGLTLLSLAGYYIYRAAKIKK